MAPLDFGPYLCALSSPSFMLLQPWIRPPTVLFAADHRTAEKSKRSQVVERFGVPDLRKPWLLSSRTPGLATFASCRTWWNAALSLRGSVCSITHFIKTTELMIPGLYHTRLFYSSKTLGASDRALILETLEQARWVVGGPHGAAAKLGLKRTTLIAIMRRLDISRPIHQGGTDELDIASESIRREGAHF
jgi:hypothetical protein